MLSPFLKKLLFARQLMLADGRIEILGQKEVMMPLEVLLELQKANPDAIYKIIKDGVKKSMEEYAHKIGSTNEGLLQVLEEIFETYGFGKPEIVSLDNAKKAASIRIRNSPLKDVVKKLSPEECIMPCAALAGMFSFFFKQEMDCTATVAGPTVDCQVKGAHA